MCSVALRRTRRLASVAVGSPAPVAVVKSALVPYSPTGFIHERISLGHDSILLPSCKLSTTHPIVRISIPRSIFAAEHAGMEQQYVEQLCEGQDYDEGFEDSQPPPSVASDGDLLARHSASRLSFLHDLMWFAPASLDAAPTTPARMAKTRNLAIDEVVEVPAREADHYYVHDEVEEQQRRCQVPSHRLSHLERVKHSTTSARLPKSRMELQDDLSVAPSRSLSRSQLRWRGGDEHGRINSEAVSA
ncbi:hypothetical protein B296_00019292 [Ensete ventricosum]|uniref:Uncharacterized protein n=1 Tax=Ensete ventricosum TaxID=4639 RepID=A0A426ZC02_ENSVE|nr:hypothetical protein B296_00019292 [Ensete ventricosum]